VRAGRASLSEPTRTLFLGSGRFALPILDALAASPGVQLVGVVSATDRTSGRRGQSIVGPVAGRARDLGLPLLQPDRIRAAESIAAIVELGPELGVLADYGQLIPPALLAVPAHGILNLHPSALPRHRGATPIEATIVAGDPVAGVSLIQMDEGLDSGPLIDQETWPLDGTETAPELEVIAAHRGAALLLRNIDGWLRGVRPAMPQPATGVTLTRPLRREDGRLDPARSAVDLERQVRAYLPWPGSFVETGEGRLIVHASQAAAPEPPDQPGTLVVDGDGLALTTVDGRLRLLEVQLAGRRTMDGASLRRGAPGLVGRPISLR
jgi:methionyl-tRNA formyltransferase